MNYTVTCDCGKSFDVRASEAGSEKQCACGATISIPSLSVLRQSTQFDSATDKPHQQAITTALIFGIALLVIVAVGILSPRLLIFVGVLMILAGRCWLAIQILAEMALPDAMLVFFVPFMPTLFLFKRFDIAWKPFLFGICGIVVLMVGNATNPP